MSARLAASAVVWRAQGRTILDGVSLECRPGVITGVLGPNGSGKTSLLRVLAGLVRPDAGQVHLDEGDLRRDVHRMPGRERARCLAIVEQESATSLDLTVRDVVELGRVPHRPLLAAGDRSGEPVVAAAMATADVTHLADRRWRTLSGGERQRTQLARALAQQPTVLVLDEPTNHLDLRHQLDFLDRIRGSGLTVVAALHDLELAAAYCDDVAVLDQGHVVQSGPVTDVLCADLIGQVYGVDVTVEPHPERPRPHVRWNGVIGR